MALDANIRGSSTGNGAEVDSSNRLKVIFPTGSVAADTGGAVFFSENDPGTVLGTRYIQSPETDDDYRLRVAQDTPLDWETFNYTAQNTGKFNFLNTTMTGTWATGGFTTNGSSITTTTTGLYKRTYQTYSLVDPGVLQIATMASLSASTVPSNTLIDIGLHVNSGSNPYTPTDGVMFRMSSAGIFGVINHNGTETTTSPFTFTPTANRVYSFMIVVHERVAEFWIDNVLYGEIDVPIGQGQVFASTALPWAVRHVIMGGAAGGVFQLTVRDYSIAHGGVQVADTLGTIANRSLGTPYQGSSGGTMGTTASYANSADPTAAATLSNTAALVTGLGGQFRFNAAATAVTDGIVTSFQVPAISISTGRSARLKITGVVIDAVNTGAAVATTATTLQWSLAFGHTAVSLATAEAATAKAPRRVALGIQTWAVGAAIGAQPQTGAINIDFSNGPIYVNAGEFVQTVAKFIVGTATASQVIWGTVTFIATWE